MTIDLEELRDHWENLENSFHLLENRSLLMKPREFRKLVADIGAFSDQMKAMKNFIERADSEDPIKTKEKTGERDAKGQQAFQDFFSDLGIGLVETQKKLDRHSEDYLRKTQHKKYLQPTVFRVPKISGELKVAIDQEKNKGLNLVLFSQKSKSRNLREQTLNFEMVGAPMPPGSLPDLDQSVPGLHWVLSRAERREIADTIAACLEENTAGFEGTMPNGPEAKRHAASALAGLADNVLVFRAQPGEALFLATPYHQTANSGQKDRFLGVWKLNPAEPPKLTQVWKCKHLTAQAKQTDFDRLMPHVDDLIQRQKAFFSSLQSGT